MRGVYAGRLRNAHQVEAFTANLIAINKRYKAHAGHPGHRPLKRRPRHSTCRLDAVRPRRVVSLVPSLTEAVAATRRRVCWSAPPTTASHPRRPRRGAGRRHEVPGPGAAYARRDPTWSSRTPRRTAREDVDALRAAGIPVWVTDPRTLTRRSLARPAAGACWRRDPPWLAEAPRRRGRPPFAAGRRRAVGAGLAAAVGGAGLATPSPATCCARLGVDNVYGDGAGALSAPVARRAAARRAGPRACCPTSRTRSRADDGPEAFPGLPSALVSGRHLTWYGPSLVEARDVLAAALTAATGLEGVLRRRGTRRRGPRRRTARVASVSTPAQVGVPLDEARHLAGAQAGHVLPDQHLRVGVRRRRRCRPSGSAARA